LSFGGSIPVDEYHHHTLQSSAHHVHPPSSPDAEPITWAGFDTIDAMRVLIIAYQSGFQVWDLQDLGLVREMVNVRSGPVDLGVGGVMRVVVIPEEDGMDKEQDEFAGLRPLLGIL